MIGLLSHHLGRFHGQGRVFFTSLAHTEAVWEHPFFQTLLLGAFD